MTFTITPISPWQSLRHRRALISDFSPILSRLAPTAYSDRTMEHRT